MKKLWWVALSVMLVGLAGWLLLIDKKPQPLSPPVALPDGTLVRIIAVTYGTNHVVGTRAERLAAKLSTRFLDFLNDHLNVSGHSN